MIRGITNFQTEICQQCCLILWYLKMIIMPRDESTKIASDGLRYKSKEAGSPFGGSSSMATMSCLLTATSALSQRMYDSSGRQIGRVDGERYYDASGHQIGRADGFNIYDGSGRQLGRIDGDRVYNSSGGQVGRIEGERLYSASGSQMGRIDGERIYDASGRQIGRADGLRRMQIIIYFYFFM